MEQNIPAVIFNVMYVDKSLSSAKENHFYRASGEFDSMKYVDSHADKNNLKDGELIDSLEKFTSANEHDIMGYMKDRHGGTGIFDQDGDTSFERRKELRESLRNTESTIWHAIVSFDEEHGAKFCGSKYDAHNLLANTLPAFFKNAGLDPTNMEWFAGYHVNTDNRHIHIQFWEKEPKRIDSKGYLKYSNAKINTKALNQYREQLFYFCQERNYSFMSIRGDLCDAVKFNLASNRNYEYEIWKLNSSLSVDHKYQYQRLRAVDKHIVDDFVEKLVSDNEEMKHNFAEYKKNLFASQKDIIDSYKKEKVEIPVNAKNFASSRIKEFYNRCGNIVLKTLKEINSCPKTVEDYYSRSAILESQSMQMMDAANIHSFVEPEELKTKLPISEKNKFAGLAEKISYDAYFKKLEEKEVVFVKDGHVQNIPFSPEKLLPLSATQNFFDIYDIEFSSTKTDGVYNNVGAKIPGEFLQYSFQRKNKNSVYSLNLNKSKQLNFISVLHELGMNDKQILHMAAFAPKNSLLFNLLTKNETLDRHTFFEDTGEKANSKILKAVKKGRFKRKRIVSGEARQTTRRNFLKVADYTFSKGIGAMLAYTDQLSNAVNYFPKKKVKPFSNEEKDEFENFEDLENIDRNRGGNA